MIVEKQALKYRQKLLKESQLFKIKKIVDIHFKKCYYNYCLDGTVFSAAR